MNSPKRIFPPHPEPQPLRSPFASAAAPVEAAPEPEKKSRKRVSVESAGEVAEGAAEVVSHEAAKPQSEEN